MGGGVVRVVRLVRVSDEVDEGRTGSQRFVVIETQHTLLALAALEMGRRSVGC